MDLEEMLLGSYLKDLLSKVLRSYESSTILARLLVVFSSTSKVNARRSIRRTNRLNEF